MNLYMIRNRFCRMVAAVGCCLLPFSCVQEEDGVQVPEHGQGMSLQLKVRAGADNTGTAPTTEESNIHTLRVYAFADIPNDPKDGRLVGYYYTDQVLQAPHSFNMDITFYQKGTQNVNFYVVANEKAMSTPGDDKPFTESTTESDLNRFTFTTLTTDIARDGLPMFYRSDVPVELNKDGLSNNLTFNLRRPMGKLGVYAAKPAGESGNLRITGLTMLASGTRTRNYLMPQSDETLQAITGIKGDIPLDVISKDVDKTIAPNLSDTDRKNPDNYTPVLNRPFYPFENPWGSISWNAQGDEGGNVLQIDYSFGEGDARRGLVYLPRIRRNNFYAVCCLMHNDGKITVEYTVAGWDDGGTDDLGEFDYPSYTNPITPANGTPLPEGGKYDQPTVYYNPDKSSLDGSYAFTFSITAPKGENKVWKPVLYDRNINDFSVEVYQKGVLLGDNNQSYATSADPYEIRIRAKERDYLTSSPDGENQVNKTVGLGIAYTPALLPDNTSLLLINGLTNDLKWQESTLAETIVIKQVDIPKN